MRNYEIHTYDYIEKSTGCHIIKAVTTYEGKLVYAHAKCHPEDNFDLDFGKKLALKRLEHKITLKRAAHIKAYQKSCERHLEAVELGRRRLRKVIEDSKTAYYDRLVEAKLAEKEIEDMLSGVEK